MVVNDTLIIKVCIHGNDLFEVLYGQNKCSINESKESSFGKKKRRKEITIIYIRIKIHIPEISI